MKVYLGGTVNGSTWRDFVIDELKMDYFNPVVKDWDEQAHQRELYERRHCDFVLYVITPKMTGFYSLAEVMDDAIKRPDRTIFCYLREDGEDEFSEEAITSLDNIGKRVARNGAAWLKSLQEVIEHLNSARKQTDEFALDQSDFLDAFISYGRKSSRNFVAEMDGHLQAQGFNTWYDKGLVPLEIGHLDEVNELIEKSRNFLFVISSHAVRSEYTLRELEYAKKLKKRIIPIMHEQPTAYWENVPFHIRNGKILYRTSSANDAPLFGQITDTISEENDFVQSHTSILRKALAWEKSDKSPKQLLYGADRLEASRWLKRTFTNANPPAVPSALHREYIEASEALSFSKQIMHFLNKATAVITEREAFDSFIGLVSLANPISLAPQLYTVLTTADLSSVSEYTFGLFAFLNLCFALVGIKQKNLGMFISMFLSMIMNLIIVIVKIASSG